MSVITTGNHPKELWPGIKKFWGMKYNEHPLECKELFDWDTSEKAYEEIVERIGFGLAPSKSQSGAISMDSTTQGVINRATHVAYALGYIVTYEELQDNLYMSKSKERSAANAFSMRQTKENVFANIYNRAFNASYTFGDGVSLCNSAHPTASGNQSNVLATAADLSETSLEDMTIDVMNTLNSRGLNIALRTRSLHVAPANFYNAARILKSVLQSGTGNNDVNVLKSESVVKEGCKVNHYFTDADAWFIRTDCPNGMLAYQREEISFDTDNDFSTKNAMAAAYERYSGTVGDWRAIRGTAGS